MFRDFRGVWVHTERFKGIQVGVYMRIYVHKCRYMKRVVRLGLGLMGINKDTRYVHICVHVSL